MSKVKKNKVPIPIYIFAFFTGFGVIGLFSDIVYAEEGFGWLWFFKAIIVGSWYFNGTNWLLKGEDDAPKRAVKVFWKANIFSIIANPILISFTFPNEIQTSSYVQYFGFLLFVIPFWWGGWTWYFLKSKSVREAYEFNDDEGDDESGHENELKELSKRNPVIKRSTPAQKQTVRAQAAHAEVREHKAYPADTVMVNVGHRFLKSLQGIEERIVPVHYFRFDVAKAYMAGCLYFVYVTGQVKGKQSDDVKLVLRCLYQGLHEIAPDITPQQFQTDFNHLYRSFMQTNPDVSSPKAASESVAHFVYQTGIGQDEIPDGEQQYVMQIATNIFNGMMIIHKVI